MYRKRLIITQNYKIKALIVGLVSLGTIALSNKASANVITVKAGDTVSRIAQANNTSTKEIKKLNNLKNENLIFIGDKLEVDSDRQVKPVQQNTPVQQPVQQVTQPVAQQAQPQNNSAKDAIIYAESRGQVNVTNGRYYGIYQMDISRLNGDTSIANQEAVAQKYMQDRYGSWENAWSFHQANGYW